MNEEETWKQFVPQWIWDDEEKIWELLEGCLWQYITKEHMEVNTGQTITDEEWELFVERIQNPFADEVSQLATEFWNDYDPKDWE